MTDVQRCDGCGAVRHMHYAGYEMPTDIVDVESSRDAIDIRQEGDLCRDCAREVAKTIRSLGE